MQSVTFKGTHRELKKLLSDLPALISGKKVDTLGLGRSFKHCVAYHLWSKIEEGFLIKSWGGTDSLGITWKPLSRSTIAYRPLAKGEATKYKLPRNRTRGLLTPAQNLLWKRTFFTMLIQLSRRMGESAARVLAAKIAWAKVKAAGARTKLEVLGNRKIQILVVSERLLRSVEAGSFYGGVYTPPPEQLFQSGHNEIRLGSKVPYFHAQNKKRTIIPKATRIGPWLRTSVQQAAKELAPNIARYLAKTS